MVVCVMFALKHWPGGVWMPFYLYSTKGQPVRLGPATRAFYGTLRLLVLS